MNQALTSPVSAFLILVSVYAQPRRVRHSLALEFWLARASWAVGGTRGTGRPDDCRCGAWWPYRIDGTTLRPRPCSACSADSSLFSFWRSGATAQCAHGDLRGVEKLAALAPCEDAHGDTLRNVADERFDLGHAAETG